MDQWPIDFFVSRRGPAAKVAQEVAQTLTDAGYTVFVQDRDIPLTANFVGEMHDALKRCRHFVALLTEDYDSSTFTREEWTNFFAAAAPFSGERRFVVLRIEDVKPRGLFAAKVYGDLFGVTDPARRRKVILAAAEARSAATFRWPKTFRGIPPHLPLFVGREGLLLEIHRAFDIQFARPSQAILHGLAGVGKTSLAAEYAHQYSEKYAGVWWITADTRMALVESLAELGGVLDLRLLGTVDAELAAKQALMRLGEATEPWLLVYDNVENPALFRDLIPGAQTNLLKRIPIILKHSQHG